jgi:hypothetical protein
MALSQADTRVTCVTGLRWKISADKSERSTPPFSTLERIRITIGTMQIGTFRFKRLIAQARKSGIARYIGCGAISGPTFITMTMWTCMLQYWIEHQLGASISLKTARHHLLRLPGPPPGGWGLGSHSPGPSTKRRKSGDISTPRIPL